MRQWRVLLLCGPALFLGVTALASSADARRLAGGHAGGVQVNRVQSINRNVSVNRNVARNINVNRNVARNVNVNRNVTRNVNGSYAYRNGRRGYWRNGVWVALPVAGAAYAASCAYEYNRWQSTGSSYWRDRYNQCAR